MKKVSKALAMLALLFTSAVAATDIPSSVSGTYQGSGNLDGWNCEIRAFQIFDGLGGSSRVLSADCQTPEGSRAGSISTSDMCITEAWQPPIPRRGDECGPAPNYCVPVGTPKLSIESYSVSTQRCQLGEIQVEITNAVEAITRPGTPGPEGYMCRTQIVVPTNPYPGCGESPAVVGALAIRRIRGFICSITRC